MDSFTEPYHAVDNISLDQVRAQIQLLQSQHHAAGVPLSGRVLHVCHYLPVIATLSNRAGVLSPPPTPPAKPVDASNPTTTSKDAASPVWTLSPRYGHAAMISGIRSLAATHEHIIIGWTGDILSPEQQLVPSHTVGAEERTALEEALKSYQPKEEQPSDNRIKTSYVPLWLDDKVAHGHYDGYCKQSTSNFHLDSITPLDHPSSPALWPLFHYLLWQDSSSPSDNYYPPYAAANAAFAARIAEVHRPGDLVWIHDYHLLLVPRLLRELVPEAYIGLFVHTPFPSSEVYRCLPRMF